MQLNVQEAYISAAASVKILNYLESANSIPDAYVNDAQLVIAMVVMQSAACRFSFI